MLRQPFKSLSSFSASQMNRVRKLLLDPFPPLLCYLAQVFPPLFRLGPMFVVVLWQLKHCPAFRTYPNFLFFYFHIYQLYLSRVFIKISVIEYINPKIYVKGFENQSHSLRDILGISLIYGGLVWEWNTKICERGVVHPFLYIPPSNNNNLN